VPSAATGKGKITIADDKTVSGSLMTTGVAGTAAHIHEAAPGKNGPPIITSVSVGPQGILSCGQPEPTPTGTFFMNASTAWIFPS